MTEVIGVIIDTETGGLDPRRDALLQVGAVAFGIETTDTHAEGLSSRLVEVDSFTVEICPDVNLSVCARALAVSHTPITEVWNPAKETEPRAYEQFVDWLAKQFPEGDFAGKLWAHNARFDAGFLTALFERTEIDACVAFPEWRLRRAENWNCTRSLASALIGTGRLPRVSRSLTGLAEHFGIETARDQMGHDALGGARLTLEVMNHLFRAAGWL